MAIARDSEDDTKNDTEKPEALANSELIEESESTDNVNNQESTLRSSGVSDCNQKVTDSSSTGKPPLKRTPEASELRGKATKRRSTEKAQLERAKDEAQDTNAEQDEATEQSGGEKNSKATELEGEKQAAQESCKVLQSAGVFFTQSNIYLASTLSILVKAVNVWSIKEGKELNADERIEAKKLLSQFIPSLFYLPRDAVDDDDDFIGYACPNKDDNNIYSSSGISSRSSSSDSSSSSSSDDDDDNNDNITEEHGAFWDDDESDEQVESLTKDDEALQESEREHAGPLDQNGNVAGTITHSSFYEDDLYTRDIKVAQQVLQIEKEMKDKQNEKKRNEKNEQKMRDEKYEQIMKDEKHEQKMEDEQKEQEIKDEQKKQEMRDEKYEQIMKDEKYEQKMKNEQKEQKLNEKYEQIMKDEKHEQKIEDEQKEKEINDKEAMGRYSREFWLQHPLLVPNMKVEQQSEVVQHLNSMQIEDGAYSVLFGTSFCYLLVKEVVKMSNLLYSVHQPPPAASTVSQPSHISESERYNNYVNFVESTLEFVEDDFRSKYNFSLRSIGKKIAADMVNKLNGIYAILRSVVRCDVSVGCVQLYWSVKTLPDAAGGLVELCEQHTNQLNIYYKAAAQLTSQRTCMGLLLAITAAGTLTGKPVYKSLTMK